MRYFLCVLLIGSFYVGSAQTQKVSECVIDKGELKSVILDYNMTTGERSIVVNGAKKDFYSLYPKEGPSYAASATWYINSEAISSGGLPYVKYGLPRVLGITDLEKIGTYKGINVYREAGGKDTAEVLYIPVRQGCEFQPYQLDCPSLFDIIGPEFYEIGKTIKLTAKKPKGGYKNGKHQWEVSGATITAGQGTHTISISTTGAKPVIRASVQVEAKELCTWASHEIYLKKDKQDNH